MYHDQGLIPFKTLNFGSGVNFTSGLPIVEHHQIMEQLTILQESGIASCTSFLKALLLARKCLIIG